MNTTDQWQALSDKDKVGAIIKLLGWACQEVGTWQKGASVAPYPIVYWNSERVEWHVFYKDDEESTIFDPLHSLDDAWTVVRKMNQPQTGGETSYDYYHNFIERLKEIVGSDMFFDLFYCDKDGDHLTPERLCQAAYLAVDEEFC
jgi:hypothetical protein